MNVQLLWQKLTEHNSSVKMEKKNNSGSKNSIQKEYTVHEKEATFKEVQLTLSYWTPL